MKRLLITLLVLVFLPLGALAGDRLYQVANPNPADRLHLREAPQESAASLGRYYNGTTLLLLEDGKDWVRVRIGDAPGALEGYMRRTFIRLGDVPSAMPEYMSTSSAWELLDQPAANSSYRMVGYGVEFLLMGFSNNWWHVTTRDGRLTGFVPATSNILIAPKADTVINNPNPADRLNLRKEPSKSAPSLGKYYRGVRVTVLGYANDNLWARVRIGDLEGYMDAAYLVDAQNAKSIQSAIPTVQVSVPQGQHLFLRSASSDKSSSLGRFANGTAVEVLGVGSSWYHVRVGGKIGFMMASYLSPKLPQ